MINDYLIHYSDANPDSHFDWVVEAKLTVRRLFHWGTLYNGYPISQIPLFESNQ